jgi:NADH-quinone oxidoreductase subunit C
MMDAAALVEVVKARVAGVDVEAVPAVDCVTLVVPSARLVEVCTVLRDDASLRFLLLADLTAVDWWPGEPRFEVVYHLASFAPAERLRLKTRLGGKDPRVATVSTVWPVANWLEREVYDLFGIVFDGHPDLRRLMMPDDWVGHPLRKDYPVQVRTPVNAHEPLQLSEREFLESVRPDSEKTAKS